MDLEEQFSQEAAQDALNGVVAHGLLNSMAVIVGALKTLSTHWDRLTDQQRQHMLHQGTEQANLISESLRDLVLGLPLGASMMLKELDLQAAERRHST